MMDNCTSCLSEDAMQKNFIQYCLYIVQGIFLSGGNLVIFAAILLQPLMRRKKEYIIVAGFTLINGLNGVATLISGIGRNIYIVIGTANDLVTRWGCFTAPWNIIWQLSHSLIPVMLMLVSLDRLFAVSLPLVYYQQDWRYGMKLVGVGYGYSLIQMLVGAVMTIWYSFEYPDDLVPKTCMMGWSSNPHYHVYLVNQRLLCSGMSVLLYGFVVYFYGKNKSKVFPNVQSAQASEARKQRKMAKTLGISALVTLIFYVLPLFLELFTKLMKFSPDTYTVIGAYIFMLNNMDPLLDFFIFTIRHNEIKLATKFLFRCKRMNYTQFKQANALSQASQAQVSKASHEVIAMQQPHGLHNKSARHHMK